MLRYGHRRLILTLVCVSESLKGQTPPTAQLPEQSESGSPPMGWEAKGPAPARSAEWNLRSLALCPRGCPLSSQQLIISVSLLLKPLTAFAK